jgi:arginyl-tRNA synthetase
MHRGMAGSRNLVERLRLILCAEGEAEAPAIAPLRDVGRADLAVIATDAETAVEASKRLVAHPEVVAARRSGPRLLLTLDDALVAEAGMEIEAGATGPFATDDLLAGQRHVVEFCDPNATKALHLGHLRNIALGHAFASALAVAGSEVETQSQVSDAGHQVGEAMAGYLRYGEGVTPERAGKRGDRLVGELYARYVAEETGALDDVAPSDLPIAREMRVRDDLATALLRRWRAGDADAVALWRTICDWVLAGQNATLARLGARVDRPLLESSYFDSVDALVEVAVERGVLAYAPDGALVYRTGRDEYPTFPLTRVDGFPTLNLRAITIWHELTQTMPDVTTFHVCGDEWKAHTVYVGEILRGLHPDRPVQPTHDIVHGMVSGGDGVLSSSTGDALLIDELLDDLAARDVVRQLTVDGRRGCEAEDLAVMIALGCCLERPLAKPLVMRPDALLDPHSSAGFTFARAWSKAWGTRADGRPDPEPQAPEYRFVVMQSQLIRQLVAHTVDRRDVLALTRFLARLGEWYLALPSTSASTDRLVRALLSRGFGALGLVRAQPRSASPGAALPEDAEAVSAWAA